jgi:hypothetical protein
MPQFLRSLLVWRRRFAGSAGTLVADRDDRHSPLRRFYQPELAGSVLVAGVDPASEFLEHMRRVT